MKPFRFCLALFCIFACGAKAEAASAKPEMVLQLGHTAALEDLAWSRDGKMAASAAPDSLKLWKRDGTLIRTIASPKKGRGGDTSRLAFSPDGKKLFYSTGGLRVFVFSVADGRLLKKLGGSEYSDDGSKLIEHSKGTMTFLDAQSGKILGRIKDNAPEGETESLEFSPDGRRVVVGGDARFYGAEGKLRVWDIARGKLLFVLSDAHGAQKESAVYGPVAWSPDGKTVATGGNDVSVAVPYNGQMIHPYAIKFWDAQSGKMRRLWRGQRAGYLRFLDARRLLTGDAIWDTRSGKRLVKLEETAVEGQTPRGPLRASPDGRLLLSSDGSRIAIWSWSLAIGKPARRFAGAAASGFGTVGFGNFAWSRDGKNLGGSGGEPQLWDARSGRLLRVLPGMNNTTQLQLLPDGSVAASNLAYAYFWDAQGKFVRQWPPKDSQILGRQYSGGVSVSPDGQFLLTAPNVWKKEDGDVFLHIWSGSGEKLHTIKRLQNTYIELRLMRWLDGSHFMQGGKGGIKLWDAATGEIERIFSDPVEPAALVWSAVASADGKVIAGQSSRDKSLLAWNRDGSLRRVIRAQSGAPLALSPDGALLAAVSGSAIHIFATRAANDPEKRAPDKPLRSLSLGAWLPSFETALSWSPDGANLAFSKNGTVRLFDPRSGALRLTFFVLHAPRSDRLSRAPDAWIVSTRDGFYDASPGADKFIRWRVSNQIFPAARFARQFKQPAKVRAALRP